MPNKILDVLVKEASAGDIARGYVSPAWMENHIAKKHGKEGLKGVGENVGTHVVGSLRSAGRGYAQGLAGAAAGAGIGAGVGKLLKKKVPAAAVIGAVSGFYPAAIHGSIKSLSNQAREAEHKYSEKKAAYDALIEEGASFEDAVALVKEAAALEGEYIPKPGTAMATRTGVATKGAGKAEGLLGKIKNLATSKMGKIGLGVAAAGAVGAYAGSKMGQKKQASEVEVEKKAALDTLMEAGVDFDQAVDLVKEASEKVYGQ